MVEIKKITDLTIMENKELHFLKTYKNQPYHCKVNVMDILCRN